MFISWFLFQSVVKCLLYLNSTYVLDFISHTRTLEVGNRIYCEDLLRLHTWSPIGIVIVLYPNGTVLRSTYNITWCDEIRDYLLDFISPSNWRKNIADSCAYRDWSYRYGILKLKWKFSSHRVLKSNLPYSLNKTK